MAFIDMNNASLCIDSENMTTCGRDHTTSSIVLPRLLRPRLLFLRSEARMMSAVMLEARIGSLEAFVAIWVLTIVHSLLSAMLVSHMSL
jgi:hypothetical protein